MSPSTPPPPGTMFGRWRLGRILGEGGFSWVFETTGHGGKLFAIKVLKPPFRADREFLRRCRSEALEASRLNHPNIVAIEEVGGGETDLFIAMRRYPGSLATRLGQNDALAEPELYRLARGLGAALAHAHGQGILHRDVKPANVLLDESGEPVLADFGIARATASGTGVTIGTPAYLSPEQAQGRPSDARSDLYALGILLYRASTGVVPFQARDWFELARLHVEVPPEAPRTRRPSLAPILEKIILRLLAKHPEDRYPSAETFLAALETIHPEPEGFTGWARRLGWGRRR